MYVTLRKKYTDYMNIEKIFVTGIRSKNTYNKSSGERNKGWRGSGGGGWGRVDSLAYHEYLKLIVLQLINISLKGYQKRGHKGWLGWFVGWLVGHV